MGEFSICYIRQVCCDWLLFVGFYFSLLHEYAHWVILVGGRKKSIYWEEWRFRCLMLCMEWLDE